MNNVLAGNSYDYIFKLVMVGNTVCGKTSIMARFTKDDFKIDSGITIGVDFSYKTIEVDSHKIKFQMWDTAGQELFRTITKSYYAGVAIALIIFDLTEEKSLMSVESWIKEVRDYASEGTILILVGNKLDLTQGVFPQKHKISNEKIDRVMAKNNIKHYFEVSAKTNEGIDELFYSCAKLVLNNIIKNPKLINMNNGIKCISSDYVALKEDLYSTTKQDSCCSIS
jgi:small GTP-binding protein